MMIFSILAGGVRALQGGGVGQLHAGIKIALVLFGQEPAGHLLAEHPDGAGHHDEQEQADDALADEPPAEPHVAVGGLAEHVVEPAVERSQGAAGLLLGLQDQGAQSAGLSVRALKAEMMTEMAMVTANCW